MKYLLLAIILVASQSYAASRGETSWTNGKALFAMCKAPGGSYEKCAAYVTGVLDTAEALYENTHGGERWMCTSPTKGDVIGAVSLYVEAHPETRNANAVDIVMLAIDARYNRSCRRAQNHR